MMRFRLSPHIKLILCGRGMCKGDRLLCAASNCIFQPEGSPDPDFGRDIKIKGYAICPRCGNKTDWEEGKEEDTRKRKTTIMRCMACNKIIPRKFIVWTQEVVSKHRRSRHEYFHGECWDAMFLDIPDDESVHFSGYRFSDDIMRLIKWATRAR